MFYFGYRVPEGTKAYWGCRAILEGRSPKHRYVDFVWDRQSIEGPEEDRIALSGWLNGTKVGLTTGSLKKALDKATELYKDYKITSDMSKEFVLYEDEKGIVLGNPCGSFGYLYMSAYFKE